MKLPKNTGKIASLVVMILLAWVIMRWYNNKVYEGYASTENPVVLEIKQYMDNVEEIHPFIVYGMAKKLSKDDEKLTPILEAAAAGDKEKVMKLVSVLA